jgi:hypothetical protein
VKIWGGVLLCALVACSLAATPAAAAEDPGAKPRFEVHERALRLSLRFKASNGYEGRVTTQGHRRVTLTLQKGSVRVEARTSGRVTRRGIEAEFGELGRISMRFRGRPTTPRFGLVEGGCRGRKSELEEGVFSGTIRFLGENDFAQIGTRRATGDVERHYRRVCPGNPRGASLKAAFERLFGAIRLTVLRASGRVAHANVVLQASAIDFSPIFGPHSGLMYSVVASSAERREGVRLTRTVSTISDADSFLFPHKRGTTPRWATVTPPKPLTGTAEYLREPGRPASWAGSLAAHLPGAGLVPLTGPGFRADMCHLTFATLLDGDSCLPKPGQAQQLSLSDLGDRGPLPLP